MICFTSFYTYCRIIIIIVFCNDISCSFLKDGTIGNDIVIKPVPSQLSSSISADYSSRDDDEMFLDEDEEAGKNTSTKLSNSKSSISSRIPKTFELANSRKDINYHKNAHIVYKRKMYDSESHSDYLKLEPGTITSISGKPYRNWTLISTKTSSKRRKRQAPDTVWPEVLLVVDYDSYLLHGANSRDVKRYFISFWNGVDLRYKLLTNPLIRVSLAGMIVAKVS